MVHQMTQNDILGHTEKSLLTLQGTSEDKHYRLHQRILTTLHGTQIILTDIAG